MPEGFLYAMTGALIVSALALVLQLLILFGLYRSFKAMQAQVLELLPQLRRVAESAETTLHQSRKQLNDITSKANEVLDLTRAQLTKVDESLGDVLVRLKSQLERAELVVDDSLTRVHQTVSTVHNGVMRPLREIAGVGAGIRAALHTLARGGRPNVAEATHDEEMFI